MNLENFCKWICDNGYCSEECSQCPIDFLMYFENNKENISISLYKNENDYTEKLEELLDETDKDQYFSVGGWRRLLEKKKI